MANLSAVGVGFLPCCASQRGPHSMIANTLIEEAKRSANIPHVARRLSLLRAWTFRRAPVSSRSNDQSFRRRITRAAQSVSREEKMGATRNGALGLLMVVITGHNSRNSATRSAVSHNYFGSFDAITSIFSIEGDFARSSDAFSFRACATLPFRCALRPESSANVSKIP